MRLDKTAEDLGQRGVQLLRGAAERASGRPLQPRFISRMSRLAMSFRHTLARPDGRTFIRDVGADNQDAAAHPGVLTRKLCRGNAAALSRLAADAVTDAEASRLDALAREWAVLEATVTAIEGWEPQLLHGQHAAATQEKVFPG
jgi:hypothetical protein